MDHALETIRLAPGALLTFDAPAGRALQVTLGRVWLTQSGEPDDHFLAAGDDHRLALRGRVVIECQGRDAACLQLGAGPRLHDRAVTPSKRRGAGFAGPLALPP